MPAKSGELKDANRELGTIESITDDGRIQLKMDRGGRSGGMVAFFNRDNALVERPLPSDGESLPPLPTEACDSGREAAPALSA